MLFGFMIGSSLWLKLPALTVFLPLPSECRYHKSGRHHDSCLGPYLDVLNVLKSTFIYTVYVWVHKEVRGQLLGVGFSTLWLMGIKLIVRLVLGDFAILLDLYFVIFFSLTN